MVSVPAPVDVSAQEFLQVAGHPLRWQLLSVLSRSDRRVSELTTLVGQPQNAVSYHLARLRTAGLVSMRRSSADHRDSYYRFELARCGELLAATGAALHPGLAMTAPAASPRAETGKVGVLFLCTGNSARSQIAESLLDSAAHDWVDAASAGSHPKPLHPNAVRVMRSRGLDISGRKSKHLDTFAHRRFDYVITLCDKVREVCPPFPGHPESIHWSIPDPGSDGAGAASYPTFRRVADDLQSRVDFLTHRLRTTTTKG